MIPVADSFTPGELAAFHYAYKRGLEEAAEIVRREMQSDGAWSQEIIAVIRAKIQENDG